PAKSGRRTRANQRPMRPPEVQLVEELRGRGRPTAPDRLMSGPPPKPTERKRRAGNPGHAKLPAKASVVAIAPISEGSREVPEHLGEAGRFLSGVMTGFATPWLAPTDEPLVRKVCEAADRRAELLARIEADGFVLYTDKGYAYAHPCVGMLSTLEAQMTKWYSLLGITPADRTRLGVAEVQKQSTLERLRLKREGTTKG